MEKSVSVFANCPRVPRNYLLFPAKSVFDPIDHVLLGEDAKRKNRWNNLSRGLRIIWKTKADE